VNILVFFFMFFFVHKPKLTDEEMIAD